MDHGITPELTAAFTRRAAALGYEIRETPQEGDETLLTAYLNGDEVCKFETGGAMRFMQDNPLIGERESLHSLLLDMKQAHDLYVEASPLEIAGVKDFRKISDFGNFLLAARMGKDNEVRFTTWKYDYDRAGVTWGHCYETNYEGAKRDFAIRAGLIDENQLFTEEELVALHEACVYRGRNDDKISYEDDKKLQVIIDKVEKQIFAIAKQEIQRSESVKVQERFRKLNMEQGIKILNEQAEFAIVNVGKNGSFSFSAVTEENDNQYSINYSERSGSLEQFKDTHRSILDVFYSDEFQRDGRTVYYEDFIKEYPTGTVTEMLSQVFPIDQYVFIKAGWKLGPKEVAEFEEGNYIIIFEDEKVETAALEQEMEYDYTEQTNGECFEC